MIGGLGRRYPALKEQLEDEGQAEERDMSELRTWEKVMMDCLIGKDLSELDKRCWLEVESIANVSQDQIPGVRRGQLPVLAWRRKRREMNAGGLLLS